MNKTTTAGLSAINDRRQTSACCFQVVKGRSTRKWRKNLLLERRYALALPVHWRHWTFQRSFDSVLRAGSLGYNWSSDIDSLVNHYCSLLQQVHGGHVEHHFDESDLHYCIRVAAAAVWSRLLCRKRKMDMEQQMLAWRVLYEDIEFMGSVTTNAAGSTVWPSFSAY